MKRFIVFLIVVFFGGGMAFANGQYTIPESKKDEPKSICPKTLRTDCTNCHIGSDNRLKETLPDAHFVYPSGVKIINGNGYMQINEISGFTADKVEELFRYLLWKKIGVAILDIHSPGGSLFDAWKIKGLMNEFQERGNIVETRVRGFAASAGTIIFLAGTLGHRIANPQSELMFHELWSFKFFDVASVSDKESEAAVMRHLQDTINEWLSTRGKLTKSQLDERVKKKEFWLNGKEAFDLGFVDKLVIGK